jgi:hypothetical protein
MIGCLFIGTSFTGKLLIHSVVTAHRPNDTYMGRGPNRHAGRPTTAWRCPHLDEEQGGGGKPGTGDSMASLLEIFLIKLQINFLAFFWCGLVQVVVLAACELRGHRFERWPLHIARCVGKTSR